MISIPPTELHSIYPLLVAAGVALGIIPLGVTQSAPQKVPPIVDQINKKFIELAAFLAIAGSFIGLLFVVIERCWLYYTDLYSVIIAFGLLVMAFIIPTFVQNVPPLWKWLFYPQFETTQENDQAKLDAYKPN